MILSLDNGLTLPGGYMTVQLLLKDCLDTPYYSTGIVQYSGDGDQDNCEERDRGLQIV